MLLLEGMVQRQVEEAKIAGIMKIPAACLHSTLVPHLLNGVAKHISYLYKILYFHPAGGLYLVLRVYKIASHIGPGMASRKVKC